MAFIELGGYDSNAEFLALFIVTVLILWIVLVLYSLRYYGPKKTIRYVVPMMIAALFLEAAAVASGRYSYPGYLVYISIIGGSVPLIILMGWSVNLFLFLKLSEQTVLQLYKKRNLVSVVVIALVTGLFGVCLDVLEDPLAHHNQWWVWTESSTMAGFFGVPWSNFADWFLILFYMALATQLIERSGLSENRKLIISILSVSFIGLAIYASHTLISLL